MPTAGDTVIEVHGLTKRFADVVAVDAIDFHISRGEVFGLLGPNGAGKTTTINLLTGLARPSCGTIRIADRDVSANVKQSQHLMGIVPDESNLYPELSGVDNLCFCASLYGMGRAARRARAMELLETFGLADVRDRKFAAYSRGMKRKLAIAAGLIHQPPILFLDEPTTGIDVTSARQIRQLLAGFKASGITLFLTTHYIEEAERLCDRVAFMVRGRLARVDTMEVLLRGTRGRHGVELALSADAAAWLTALGQAFPHAQFDRIVPASLRVHTTQPFPLAPLVQFLSERGIDVIEARTVRETLEDVFVEITGTALASADRPSEQGGTSS
jgi:ABC-2 type transport system ATP-binding protein